MRGTTTFPPSLGGGSSARRFPSCLVSCQRFFRAKIQLNKFPDPEQPGKTCEVYVVEHRDHPVVLVALEAISLFDDRKTAMFRALRVHKVFPNHALRLFRFDRSFLRRAGLAGAGAGQDSEGAPLSEGRWRSRASSASASPPPVPTQRPCSSTKASFRLPLAFYSTLSFSICLHCIFFAHFTCITSSATGTSACLW